MSRAVWAVLVFVEILKKLELKMNALTAVPLMLGRAGVLNRLRAAVPEGVPPELLKKHWFYNKKRGARASGSNGGNATGAETNAKIKKLRVLVDIKDIVDT